MTSPAIEREAQRQLEVMRDGAVDFYGEDELRQKLVLALQEKRSLRFKLGMDPSAPDLHIGHTVVLNRLRRIQDLGHTPIFLIGDFTGNGFPDQCGCFRWFHAEFWFMSFYKAVLMGESISPDPGRAKIIAIR